MTKETLSKSSQGETVAYKESAAERAERLREAVEQYAVRYTPAQRRAVANANQA